MLSLPDEALTGSTSTHVLRDEGLGMWLHPATRAAFLALREDAASAGFDLAINSGFRTYDLQRSLWNARARGERPIRDRAGRELDRAALAPAEIAAAILNWLAAPGASRHHWGSDLDVFDRGGAPTRFHPDEALEGAPHARFRAWLIEAASKRGFFHPYAEDLGGVAPEWWHVSYRPLAESALPRVTAARLLELWSADPQLELRDELVARADEIVERYVRRVASGAR